MPALIAGIWFYEYFDGDIGAGLGAACQTGWMLQALLSAGIVSELVAGSSVGALKWALLARVPTVVGGA